MTVVSLVVSNLPYWRYLCF